MNPNIIFIMTDTLRYDYLGINGMENIQTPNIDQFAKDSIIFDNAYPESLPTIPVRRAIHTGRRAFPFKNYKPVFPTFSSIVRLSAGKSC